MSEKIGQKPINSNNDNKRRAPLISEFSQRYDGKFNLWQKRFVSGLSSHPRDLVWVINGVYNKVPAWAKQQGTHVIYHQQPAAA